MSATVIETPKGSSLVRTESGEYVPCAYPTPGFANDARGYAAFCESDARTSPASRSICRSW